MGSIAKENKAMSGSFGTQKLGLYRGRFSFENDVKMLVSHIHAKKKNPPAPEERGRVSFSWGEKFRNRPWAIKKVFNITICISHIVAKSVRVIRTHLAPTGAKLGPTWRNSSWTRL